MSDVVAYWSNYEQHKVEVDSAIRHKICICIQDEIEQSKNKAVSDEFIAGMQYAKTLILGTISQ